MKTPEEFNNLKEEVETVNKKFHKLSDEELMQVSGGLTHDHYVNVVRKVGLLHSNEKITTAQGFEIMKQARTLNEDDYGWWALDYAARHGLQESDISYW